jgi:hypothetical protein
MSDAVHLPSEQGPQMHLQPVWIFELGQRDALLVLRALGGRLSTPEETEAARTLGNRLTMQREKLAQGLTKGLEIAAAAARADDVNRGPQ